MGIAKQGLRTAFLRNVGLASLKSPKRLLNYITYSIAVNRPSLGMHKGRFFYASRT